MSYGFDKTRKRFPQDPYTGFICGKTTQKKGKNCYSEPCHAAKGDKSFDKSACKAGQKRTRSKSPKRARKSPTKSPKSPRTRKSPSFKSYICGNALQSKKYPCYKDPCEGREDDVTFDDSLCRDPSTKPAKRSSPRRSRRVNEASDQVRNVREFFGRACEENVQSSPLWKDITGYMPMRVRDGKASWNDARLGGKSPLKKKK
jgi:hypothetical protein